MNILQFEGYLAERPVSAICIGVLAIFFLIAALQLIRAILYARDTFSRKSLKRQYVAIFCASVIHLFFAIMLIYGLTNEKSKKQIPDVSKISPK